MFKDSSSKDKDLQSFQILVSYSRVLLQKLWEGGKKSQTDEVAYVYQMTFISYEVWN